MGENPPHPACMFSCLTTSPIVYELLTVVTLCRVVPSLRLNLLALVDKIIAEKAKQLLVKALLLSYLYV